MEVPLEIQILIDSLVKEVQQLKHQIAVLEEKLLHCEHPKNSSDSSILPSQDPYRIKKDLYIGNEIRKELSKQNRSIAWLANQVGIDRSNLNKLLDKDHINFKLLNGISIALKKDFFKFYSDQLSDDIE